MATQPLATQRVEYVDQYLTRLTQTLAELDRDQVARLIDCISEARAHDRQIFVCGNGGSTSTASHFAIDLGKGASMVGNGRFRILSVTDNTGWITALGNDLSFDDVFVEQLKNYARPNDVVVAISCSGSSPNVVKAIEWAKENDCFTVGLTGKMGGRMKDIVDLSIEVPSDHMGRIEDAHLIIVHMICYYFMEVGR